MKSLLRVVFGFLLMFTVILSFSGTAIAGTKRQDANPFLSYAEFKALTPSEQISYIRDVRDFVRNLTKENDFFAETPHGKALFALIGLLQSEVRAEVQSTSAQAGSTATGAATTVGAEKREQTAAELVASWKAKELKAPCIKDKLNTLSSPGVDLRELASIIRTDIRGCVMSVYTVGDNPRPAGQYRRVSGNYLDSATEAFLAVEAEVQRRSKLSLSKADQDDFASVVFAMEMAMNEFTDPANRPPNFNEHEAKINEAKKRIQNLSAGLDENGARRSKGSLAPAVAPAPGRGRVPAPAPSRSPGPAHKDWCIAAGFVHSSPSNAKCPSVSKLPSFLSWDDETEKKFVCLKRDEIMCNPFLYGYVKECKVSPKNPSDAGARQTTETCSKKPLCIRPVKATSEECYNASNSSDALKNISEIWQSPKGEEIYENFIDLMKKACSQASIGRLSKKSDIVKNCVSAKKTLSDKIHADYKSSAGDRVQEEADRKTVAPVK
jgi:hypothetical protein